MAFTYIFKRIEKKYILTEEQYRFIRDHIDTRMSVDRYGETVINNIYFDNELDELIESSLKKPVYKEKLRLRVYGEADENATSFFEIKKKYQGVVYKRRISLPLKDAYDYIESGKLPQIEGNIPSEIDYMIKRYRLSPKAYIGYRRIAMVDNEDPELRITFDTDVTSRYDNIALEEGLIGHRVLPEKTYLMEIKIPGAMPVWLARMLDELKIYPTSFSKYGKAYLTDKGLDLKFPEVSPEEMTEEIIQKIYTTGD